MIKRIIFSILFIVATVTYSQEESVESKFDNDFYLTTGLSQVVGNSSVSQNYTFGGSFRFGNVFYVDVFSPGSNFGIGFDVSYLNLTLIPNNYNYGEGGFFIFGFMQFGPSLAYSLSDDMIFDAYFKVKPSYGYKWNQIINQSGFSETNIDNGISLLPSFGVGLKVSVIKVGLEMEVGKRNFSSSSVDNSFTQKIPYYTLWMGFSF